MRLAFPKVFSSPTLPATADTPEIWHWAATYHGTKGYHVIWLQAVKASTVQPFSAVQAQIKQQLLQNSADALYQSWTQKLEKAQKITIK